MNNIIMEVKAEHQINFTFALTLVIFFVKKKTILAIKISFKAILRSFFVAKTVDDLIEDKPVYVEWALQSSDRTEQN